MYGDSITADIQAWCRIISQNSHDPALIGTYRVYIDPATGLDLAEMYQKTVLGGVAFSHGINTYLKHVEIRNNKKLVTIGTDTMNYTEKEHHFDEVFGYSGLSRNFLDFTDQEVADVAGGRNYKDNVVVDGKIDLQSEYNYSFAVEAAKRDLSSAVHTDFTRKLYDAFYFGRLAIIRNDDPSLLVHKQVILETWEEILAATAIHHLNLTLAELDKLHRNPGESPELLYRHWASMYTYIEAFRYNYNNRLILWEWILDHWVRPNTLPWPKALVDDRDLIPQYQDSLRMAREAIRETYGFAFENAVAW